MTSSSNPTMYSLHLSLKHRTSRSAKGRPRTVSIPPSQGQPSRGNSEETESSSQRNSNFKSPTVEFKLAKKLKNVRKKAAMVTHLHGAFSSIEQHDLLMPSPAATTVLNTLREQLQTHFDPDTNPRHMALLKRLWKSLWPNLPFCRVGPGWCRAGFQNPDPVSDVRGGGLLAVSQLAYFLERFQHVAHPMLSLLESESDDPEGHYYPWATVGINITAKLADIFGIPRTPGHQMELTPQSYWYLCEKASTFSNLYCAFFVWLDQHFHADPTNGYMDVPDVMKWTQRHMKHAIERAQTTNDDLLSFITNPTTDAYQLSHHHRSASMRKKSQGMRKVSTKTMGEPINDWKLDTTDVRRESIIGRDLFRGMMNDLTIVPVPPDI